MDVYRAASIFVNLSYFSVDFSRKINQSTNHYNSNVYTMHYSVSVYVYMVYTQYMYS